MALERSANTRYTVLMRAPLFGVCFFLAGAAGASAAPIRIDAIGAAPETAVARPAPLNLAIPALQPGLNFSLSPSAPASVLTVQLQAQALTSPAPLPVLQAPQVPTAHAAAARADASRPADFKQEVRQLSAAVSESGRQTQTPAADGGREAADRQFALLTGHQESAKEDEPTEEDRQAALRAVILRNPTLPPRVAKVIEREMGLTTDAPLFNSIGKDGSQARNAHTNAPLGEPSAPVNPIHVIAGLFLLREDSRAYYDSLKNRQTGVVATGVRGGVDSMIDSLLTQGFVPPRSAGRNLRFKNGVYMDLPNDIHQARKYAAVDPALADGKDRYPMFIAFRAGDVHNPGTEHEGRIMGDGGTLGQVALDPVTPKDIVSIYVPKARMAQTIARLKGTALAHVQVYSTEILPNH